MDNEKYILRDSLGYLIGVSHWKLYKKMASKFSKADYDVTPDQWRVLVSLLNDGEMYQSQLALHHKKDRAGIKRLVDHLERKGLVGRMPSDDDTRMNIIKLTKEGNETVHHLNLLAKESIAESFNDFSESEVIMLKRLLTKLIDHIG